MENNWLVGHWFLILGLFLLGGFVLLLYCLVLRSGRGQKRSVYDYLLVWPLLLDEHLKKKKESSRVFVGVGLVLMFLLILCGILSHPTVR